MALGGGTFVTQNKELPGAYINFVSAASVQTGLSDRGIATMPLVLDWGVDGEIFTVTSEQFQKDSRKIFGYDFNHEKMKGLRDLFLNASTLHAYKLTSGGAKAANTYAEARYGGVRGNDIKIIIQKNVDNEASYDVKTVLDSIVVDVQSATNTDGLLDNDYVTFKTGVALTETAGTPLAGGENAEVTGQSYQDYLDKAENCSYHAMGIVTEETTVKTMAASFCKRLRDEMGVKFQTVLYQHSADYIGVVNVKNHVTDTENAESELVYWVTGIIAACAVNRSNQNKKYDGEYTVNTEYTQNELIYAKNAGEFVLHKVGTEIRVLEDINSMVSTTDEFGDIFKQNQTVRVMDQIGNDIAFLFRTKYLGVVPNDAAGRISLWSDIVKLHQQLSDIRAIEGFSDSDVVVEAGADKKSVVVTDAITLINAMGQLYMTVMVA